MSLTRRANDIADRTTCGRDAVAAGEYSSDREAERGIAGDILFLAWRRNQQVDDDQVVAFLDALRDGSSPLIAGGES